MHRCILLFLLLLVSGVVQSQTIASSLVRTGSCNAVAYSQLPTDGNYFVGRVLKNTSPADPCSGTQWALGLFRATWAGNALTELTWDRSLLSAPVQSNVNGAPVTIGSTYDPSVVLFNQELWVAFECAGSGMHLAASCIAPMRLDTGVDTSRLTVAVNSAQPNASGESYSASVPKLLVHNQQLYLYWTALHLHEGSGAPLLRDATTRGARLTQEAGGLRRLWVEGSTGFSIASNDGTHSQEVYGVNPNDPAANFVADTFDVHAEGSTIYVTAAVGGTGCSTPLSWIYGCYRLRVSSTESPLGNRVFNGNYLQSPEMPVNPQEYTRFFTAPDGSRFLMGQYLPPVLNGSVAPGTVLPTGLRRYAVDPAAFSFLPTGGSEGFTPSPTVASVELATTFSILQNFHNGCTASKALSASCLSAISRFCVSQGYAAAGYGPAQHADNDAIVLCLRSDNASRIVANISSLTELNASCTSANLISDSCSSAISRFCIARGYGAGGFGPTEWAGSSVNLTCVNSAQADRVSSTFSVLSGYNAACTGSTNPTTDSCLAASDLFCRARGDVGTYGILEHSGDAAIVACVR